jgi:hypothetical protein
MRITEVRPVGGSGAEAAGDATRFGTAFYSTSAQDCPRRSAGSGNLVGLFEAPQLG